MVRGDAKRKHGLRPRAAQIETNDGQHKLVYGSANIDSPKLFYPLRLNLDLPQNANKQYDRGNDGQHDHEGGIGARVCSTWS